MRLREVLLKNAKPGSKPRHLSDGMGLSLVIRPDGKRYWRFRYRLNGKPGLKSVGVYLRTSLKEARRLRDQYREDVACGRKPGGQTSTTGDATFAQVSEEWFRTKLPNWSKGSSESNRMRLDAYILPSVGSKPISTVTGPDLRAMLQPIQQSGKHETASRVLRVCKQVFDFGIATGSNTSNPAPAIRPLLTQPEVTHMSAVTTPEEIGWLMRKLHAYVGSQTVMAALKLAPLMFVRPGELRTARWKDFSLDTNEPVWEFNLSKTKQAHVVPLSRQAVDILRRLKSYTGYQEWVFPGPRNGRPMSANAVLVAMRALDIPKEKMTGHGLRATARTALDEQLGQRLDLIEHQLGHAVRDPLGTAYNRTKFLLERRAMMQKWADWLDELRTKSTP